MVRAGLTEEGIAGPLFLATIRAGTPIATEYAGTGRNLFYYKPCKSKLNSFLFKYTYTRGLVGVSEIVGV